MVMGISIYGDVGQDADAEQDADGDGNPFRW